MDFVLDIKKLTVGDLEDIEEICGRPLSEIDFENPDSKLMKAIVYITGRRDNPDFTIEDARQVPLSALEVDVANPTGSGEAQS